MAKKNLVTLKETLAAQAFLRTLGADWQNNALVQTVVAWEHEAIAQYAPKGSGGDLRFVSGMNPFLLAPGKWDAGERIGTEVTRIGGHTVTISRYRNLTSAFVALAKFILAGRGDSGTGFKGLVAAYRRGDVKDVLTDITTTAMARAGGYGIDTGHYVTQTYAYGQYGVWQDPDIWTVYNSFTGVMQPGVKAAAPARPVQPAIPRALMAPFRPLAYESAWRAVGFYRERHPAIKPLANEVT